MTEINPPIVHSNLTTPESVDPSQEEKIIPSTPKLQQIKTAMGIFLPQRADAATESQPNKKPPIIPETNYTELYTKVGEFESALELSDNVREVVVSFVKARAPAIREKISRFSDLSDTQIVNALANNWFEEVEDVAGSRSEVLLATMAHMVKRIETYTFMKVLQGQKEAGLSKLGIDGTLRDLTVNLLDMSTKADPLFIRFLAFAHETPKPPSDIAASDEALASLFVPSRNSLHTLGSLFPKEASYIARNFERIIANNSSWQERPGANEFKEYIETLAGFYRETDPTKTQEQQKIVESLFAKAALSGFPILVTPGMEGYYKEPFIDPELRVSLISPETSIEEKTYVKIRNGMATAAQEVFPTVSAEALATKQAKSVITLGAYGANLTFNAVAQENPVTIIYHNEQLRSYDQEFPAFVEQHITGANKSFENLDPETRKQQLEQMSRIATVLHEFGHPLFNVTSEFREQVGFDSVQTLDEQHSEILTKALIPALLENGGLEGTREQWAIASLASSLQMFRDQPKGDDYYYAAAYPLKALCEASVLEVVDDKIRIVDTDKYFEVLQGKTLELLAIMKDPRQTEKSVKRWIKQSSEPHETLDKIQTLLQPAVEDDEDQG